jgi:hypothetical protein
MARYIGITMAIVLLLGTGRTLPAQSGMRSGGGAADPVNAYFDLMDFACSQVFAGRVGGPVAQAMDLLPGFHHILSTLRLSPPSASGGGEAYGSWTAAWSKVSTAIVANIWK